MTFVETTDTVGPDDAYLVAESLDGQRDAFRQIVERYQTLICSLAYSATGDMSQSEDMAQETFISAWKDLRKLREPNKLRAWLCGIVRNRVQRSVRDERREPVRNAVPLEEANESPTLDESPSGQAVSREEEAILWRSLEKIPENYREPLVLFYRQHRSIEHVASELELSEDAVKQRLSRGRRLLQDEVQAFVENTLRRTAPGQAFSGAVLAALPLAPGAAVAAGVGWGVKGNAAALSGLLATWSMPFLGILAGFASQWVLFNPGASRGERRANRIPFVASWVFVLAFSIGGQLLVRLLANRLGWNDRTFFAAMAGFWWFYAMVITTWVVLVYRRVQATCSSVAEAGGISPHTMPMTTGARMLAMIGTNLMLFGCLISLAWWANDRLAAGVIVGIMLALSTWHFLLSRDRMGPASAVAYIGQIASSCAVVLVIFNLRFDVWAASRYRVGAADIHRLLPMALIPLLTLALVAWAEGFLLLTRPGSRVR